MLVSQLIFFVALCVSSQVYGFHLLARRTTAARLGIHADVKIVGGEPADIAEFPFQTVLYIKGNFACGGSLLSPRLMLTAAHCTSGRAPSILSMSAGSNNAELPDPRRVRRRVVQNIVHPKFNADTVDYDVAIVVLDSPIPFSSTIGEITLPGIGSQLDEDTDVFISGYGSVYDGGPSSEILLKAVVRTVSRQNCAYAYPDITDRMICAGYIFGGVDACRADSGGPLVVLNSHRMQVGIVSYGKGCADPFIPGVYTNLAHPEIHNFITNTMSMYQ